MADIRSSERDSSSSAVGLLRGVRSVQRDGGRRPTPGRQRRSLDDQIGNHGDDGQGQRQTGRGRGGWR